MQQIFNPKILSTMKGYTREQFVKDVVAGIIVAIIALPLSIALAIASGVSPEKGIYTAVIAGFLTSLLGGSRVQIGGPTAAFMVIVYGIVAEHGVDGLMIATLMAGIMLILFGVAKLGSVIKYIPYPIVTGFTGGIAVSIFTSQIKDFTGMDAGALPPEFIEKWKVYIENISTVRFEVLGVGALALLIMIVWPKINKKIPGALLALVIASAIVAVFKLDVPTIGSVYENISSSLPPFTIPSSFSIEKISALIGPAFTIAFLGAVESLLSAVASDGMIGSKHRSNTELIAQGIANAASSLFGGIPATGAIARTVANIKNGGRTPVAGMVHAVVLLLVLLFLMPLAKLIPLTALAAVLLIVAYNMSEWRSFAELMKAPKSDILILLTTFTLTVFFDLVIAIQAGIVLAAILFMKRMGDVSEVRVRNMDAGEEELSGKKASTAEEEEGRLPEGKQYRHILIYEINGPFFFGAADKFLEASSRVGEKTRVLIIKMKHVVAMDATALQAFRGLIKRCEKQSIDVILTGVPKQPAELLERSGILDRIGKDRVFPGLTPAIKYVEEHYIQEESANRAS